MMAAELQELFPFVRALATNLDNTIKLKDNTIKLKDNTYTAHLFQPKPTQSAANVALFRRP